jgi:uncharacterized membrane protein YdfJ with MMPL/SSD domain
MEAEGEPSTNRWHKTADALARLTSRRPKRVLGIAAAAFVIGVPVGLTAFTALDPFEFEDPGTESARAVDQLEDASGVRADGSVVVLVESPDGPVEQRRVEEVKDRVGAIEGVAPFPPGANGTLVSEDGNHAYIVAAVNSGLESSELTERLEAEFEGEEDVLLGGVVVAEDQIAKQSEEDLRFAELAAFPLLFLLSLIFFRGLVASTLPLVIGGMAIVGALVAMRLLHEVFPLTNLAINAVTAIGFGLAIDYSLFVVSRFREELAQGRDHEEALKVTLRTSGEAIFFSGLTVAAAMASLLLFPQQFLFSMGIGGMAVALVAAVSGLVVLPAILALLGERVNALSPEFLQRSRRATELPDSEGRWYRFSRAVMRRPIGFATGAVVVLVVLGLPATQIEFVPGDPGVLPESRSAGAVDRAVLADFPADPTNPMILQLEGEAEASELDGYRADLDGLEGVVAVGQPEEVGSGVVRMDLVHERGRYSPEAKDLVREVRAVDAPLPVQVGGLAASQVDEEASVADHIPLAASVLALTTLLLLFAMTRSVLLPVKALFMNLFSLTAALGLLVFVFQEDHLSGLFSFESQGGLQIGIVVLVFAAGFGLSTDYGVFSIVRIKELRSQGHSNREAVAIGLERTGRMITSAALLFAVAMGAIVTAKLIGVQETGFGVAAAVLVDATLVRALLVPSLMALLGEWNWWCPRFLGGSGSATAPVPERDGGEPS